MNREDRAKQFAPFDALKGLREALREKEIEHERKQKKELSEEAAQEIQSVLLKIKKGDKVKISCYESGYYITVEGLISKINYVYRYIVIGEGKVFFDDIYELKIM